MILWSATASALLAVLPILLVLVVPSLGFVTVPKHAAKVPTFLKATSAAIKELFPVLSQIEGIQWEGDCRYVDGNLSPVAMPLRGGTRYDLEEGGKCTLTSFLVFPNGKTRQVEMQGKKEDETSTAMRLDPTAEDGPISMELTELPPDTVLINEIDRATGRIIMTSSLSIVNGGTELIQVAHEVGEGENTIEGHQIWRLKQIGDFD